MPTASTQDVALIMVRNGPSRGDAANGGLCGWRDAHQQRVPPEPHVRASVDIPVSPTAEHSRPALALTFKHTWAQSRSCFHAANPGCGAAAIWGHQEQGAYRCECPVHPTPAVTPTGGRVPGCAAERHPGPRQLSPRTRRRNGLLAPL